MSSVEIGSARLRQALKDLAARLDNPRPALLEIGEDLVDSSKQRFASGTAPDGQSWAPNKPSTLAKKAPETRPLVGETHVLENTIAHQTPTNNTLVVGSPMEYAAAQQFGMLKGYAGIMKKRGLPIPWDDVPARPFLGLSSSDEDMILDTIAKHLRESIG